MLGYYNAAYTIATMWLFVPLAIVDSAFPVLLQTKKNNPEAFRPRYQLMLMAVLGIGVCAGIGLSILAPWIINLLYGPDYAPGADVLRIVAWIGILSNVGSARNIWIQAESKQSSVKYISLLSAIASIVLSVILIPIFGLNGAAIACVVSFLVSSFVATWALKSTRPFVSLYLGSFGTLYQAVRNYLRNSKAGA